MGTEEFPYSNLGQAPLDGIWELFTLDLGQNNHSLDNVTLVCIFSSKLRVAINKPCFSCGQEYLHLPVVYGMVY